MADEVLASQPKAKSASEVISMARTSNTIQFGLRIGGSPLR